MQYFKAKFRETFTKKKIEHVPLQNQRDGLRGLIGDAGLKSSISYSGVLRVNVESLAKHSNLLMIQRWNVFDVSHLFHS